MERESGGASRAGGAGFHNEDVFLVEDGLGLYLVCDGASRMPAGEVAARTVAEAVEEFVADAEEELEPRGEAVVEVVSRAMRHALSALAEAEGRDPKLDGLSTTVTMLLLQGDLGVIGHRGDSRAYLVRRGRIQQLTSDGDHTDAAPEGLGGPEAFEVFSLDLEPRDTLILCTDGAEEVVQDEAIVRAAGEVSPHLLASRIASAAHRRDTTRDATVVVVRVQGDRQPGWLELSEEPDETAFGHRLALRREGTD